MGSVKEPGESSASSGPIVHGVLLRVAYDGRRFAGFARQRNARTVAGELDGAIRAMDPEAGLARGASRTDAGVHAHGQVVAFDTHKAIVPRGWALGLTQQLPEEIAIVQASQVDPGYDPRRHALHKTYSYLILQSPVRDPFLEGRAWRVPHRLNQTAMQAAAGSLVGTHDFAAFRGAADDRRDTVRNVLRAEVLEAKNRSRFLEVRITGDRFLYHMVRIIVGTLVEIGRDRLPVNAIAQGITTGSRSDLGITAPPDGLYLEHVELDDLGRDAWPPAIPLY
jgi:tRNA pseudouridine38-40 synthase